MPTDDQYRQLLAFRTALREFDQMSRAAAESAGLTHAQHQLLLAVRGSGREPGPTISDVAEHLLVKPHTAGELVDRLSGLGYLDRVRDEADHRRVRLRLSRAGSRLLQELTEVHLEELRRLGWLLGAAEAAARPETPVRGWVAALRAEANRVLPAPMARYVEAGAREEVTRDEAVAAWSSYRLWPRVLRDVTTVSTATTLLDQELRTPIGIAPTSMQRVAHADGERAMARGAAQAGALHVVSSNAGFAFEEIAAGGPWWLQVYVPTERDLVLPLLDRAVAAGASALVLTVDTPYPGTKYEVDDADWAGIDLSWHRVNLPDDVPSWSPALVPETVGWLGEHTGLPVVVKGVLRPDDAVTAVAAGAAAVYVSNHGGRQLDRAAATAVALPAVAAALDGRAPVLVDGGVRSGLDALTALALGADAVLVGRPALWALAADGAAGVRRLLDTLTQELAEALQLSGCARPADARGLATLDRAKPF